MFTVIMNLLTFSIVLALFVTGILLLVFHKNQLVKRVLLIVRAIYFILAVFTTFVLIGKDVQVHAWIGVAALFLLLLYVIIRLSLHEWRVPVSNRGTPRTKAGPRSRRSLSLANSQIHPQAPTGLPD
jgi:Ca2+/Na+ antiporter